ncbi:MAG: aminoacyl-tRNA hydrolase [Thermoleophilia bacterium]|nr:aminoacyl-tRNA hydrolase [Thermoleophilia bacterium]
MTPRRVAEHLAARGRWGSSRSSGPGGQRRDHAETRVELTLTEEDLVDLPARIAQRLVAGLRLDERPLRLRCGTERSREQNRGIVERRLLSRVEAALAPPAPARRPTRPTLGSRQRRLAAKRLRSDVKSTRRSPSADD